jgi:RNA polymerase sigma factor (sigma-70 family)
MFIVGPAHAGKSELAIQALAPDQPAVVVGSAPTDEPAFRRRLEDLQTLRPGGWDSVYAGTDLVTTVAAATERCQQVLIDSVSQWLAALLLSSDPEIEGSEQGRAKYLERQVSDLLSHIERHPHVRFVLVSAERMEIPEDKIRKIMKIAKEPISMETPIGDDDDSHLGDFIEDGANTAPMEAAMQAGLRDVVKDILDSLTPREAKVLRMRFGIEMTSDHTLEEVGKQFDVTRERIRQIEAKALRKLKHPSRSDKLRSFTDNL